MHFFARTVGAIINRPPNEAQLHVHENVGAIINRPHNEAQSHIQYELQVKSIYAIINEDYKDWRYYG